MKAMVAGGEGGGQEESPPSQSQSESLLSEDERRALRGSKFAPLPPSQTLSRSAHPGGPVKTNKAAALAKFLERKLRQPDGLRSINPDLLELAVKNAKETVKRSGTGGPSTSGRIVRHVASFEDSFEGSGDDQDEDEKIKEKERKRKKKKITRGSRDDQDELEATEQKKRKRKKKKTAKDARSPKSHKSDKKRKIKK
ncbi:protein FAM133 isoform X1 [Ananas comosus]|uniref:Protein FAM133 isoform X1 n=1 Tax=Ananas comosus TaxID=4615 RepID=A0A6P5GID2_ANACO|nr:protein FAM133 isoform X1 [Ananas comosus]